MKKVTIDDLKKLATQFGFPLGNIQTVIEVESKGSGFLADGTGRPVILFERHKFHKFTNGRFSATHPKISNADPGGYATGKTSLARMQGEWKRMDQAIGLDREAALKSASWGMGQVMGFNHLALEYPTIQDFVNAMFTSEYCQLVAMFRFIKNNTSLNKALVAQDWKTFARLYNGKNYAINEYDKKLAAASKKFNQLV